MVRPSRWERARFSVPDTVSEERVQREAYKYMRRFGQYLERQGFVVLEMLKPVIAGELAHTLLTEPDRRLYHIFARVTRKPIILHYDIPDYAVPEMQRVGLQLQE